MDYKKIAEKMNQALILIKETSDEAGVSNILHNNMFKEMAVISEIGSIYPDVKRVKGTNKADAEINGKTIELKSSTFKIKSTIDSIRNAKTDLGTFEFDKVNNSERANEIANGYDQYAFSIFMPFRSIPTITFYFHTDKQLEKLRPLLQEKSQATLDKRMKLIETGKKGGRDSCQIHGKDLIDICSSDEDVTIFLDSEQITYTDFIIKLENSEIKVEHL